MVGDSKKIGIKLWPAPQISEHWPTRMLGRLIKIITWLMRPGTASDFTPMDGIVHEWITSFDVISIRVGVILGIINLFEVIIVRILFDTIRDAENFS
jgi:hypothetical protein